MSLYTQHYIFNKVSLDYKEIWKARISLNIITLWESNQTKSEHKIKRDQKNWF